MKELVCLAFVGIVLLSACNTQQQSIPSSDASLMPLESTSGTLSPSASPQAEASMTPKPWPSSIPTPEEPEPEISNEPVEEWTAEIIAGSGEIGYQDGNALDAKFEKIRGVCFDTTDQGIVILDDTKIRKLLPEGQVITLAGTETSGFKSVDGDRESARFARPSSCDVDSKGIIYILDYSSGDLRKLDSEGNVKSLILPRASLVSKDGPLEQAVLVFPGDILVYNEKIYIADEFRLKVIENGQIKTLNSIEQTSSIGSGTQLPVEGDIKDSFFGLITGLSHDFAGNIYISDRMKASVFTLDQNMKVKVYTVRNFIDSYHPWQSPEDIIYSKQDNNLVFIASKGLILLKSPKESTTIAFVEGLGTQITIDNNGSFYIIDSEAQQIIKVSKMAEK